MSFNILKHARIRNCTDCVNDSLAKVEYTFKEPGDFLGFDDVSGVDCLLVDSGYWFGVSVSGSCYLSKAEDISIDGSVYGVIGLEMGLALPKGQSSYPTMGKIGFKREADASWDPNNYVEFPLVQDVYRHTYSVDMTSITTWQGTISNFRIYPFIDGLSGTKVFIKSIKIESKSTYSCATGKDPPQCGKYHSYEHPCPWIGSRGFIKSSPPSGNITITQGVDDYLYVNINGYGYKKIVFDPGVGLSLKGLSYDLEEKLNLVGIGGYVNSRCYLDGEYFVISSGDSGIDSSVLVSKEGSLAKSLGFYSTNGSPLYEVEIGTAPASRYETAPLNLSSSDLSVFYASTDEEHSGNFFEIGKERLSPRAGNPDLFDFGRTQKLEFEDQTFIDINNPVDSAGILVNLYYSGDLYDNTRFCIYRRRLDGSLYLVESVDISSDSAIEDSIVDKDISVRVQKGDFIGLYSAALHKGAEYDVLNFSYYLVSGMPAEISSEPEMLGKGELGAPVYCRGARRLDESILDIEFDYPTAVESLFITASLESTEDHFNLCRASSGFGGSIFIDTYTGLNSEGVQAPSIENKMYLIDGEKYEVNGMVNYCSPGWADFSAGERPKYNYTDFWIAFEFVRNIPVEFDIDRIVFYFVDEKNIKDFALEVPSSYSLDGLEKAWHVAWSSYSSVYTDGFLADPDLYIYNNPAVVAASNYHFDYEILGYRKLDLRFANPVSTRALRYHVSFGGSYNDGVDDPAYSVFSLAPSPKITEAEIYFSNDFSHSIEGNFFVESSFDGITYLKHNDVDLVSAGLVRCTVGRPVKYLRLHLNAPERMEIFNISANITESDISMLGDSGGIIKLDPSLRDYSEDISKISITNTEDSSKIFFVDIADDLSKSEKCIFWNKLGEDTIINSEVGAGCALSSRPSFNLRVHDYAYKQPSYFLDKFFMNGATSYVSYDLGATCTSIGSLITDGCPDSYITNENTFGLFVYVYTDLEDTYNIDEVAFKYPEGASTFFDVVVYSNKNTDDPCSISENEWAEGSSLSARWLRFSVNSVNPGDSGLKKLSYIEVWLNIFGNPYKAGWKSVGTVLTDGSSGRAELGGGEVFFPGEFQSGWRGADTRYYCVDLGGHQNVTGVFPGPLSWTYEEVYYSTPGDYINLLGADLTGDLVAFSASNVDDPSRVTWSSFGTRPDGKIRWVALETRGWNSYAEDQIIVQVDYNDQTQKSSYFSAEWWTSTISTISQDFILVKNGINSLRLDYAANIGSAYDTVDFTSDCGRDASLARRDYLSFWFYISDPDQISNSDGYFKLHIPSTPHTIRSYYRAHDTSAYYQWNLSDVFSVGLSAGWNFILLPFSDNYKASGDIYLVSDNPPLVGDDYTRDRINGISFQCKVKENNDSFHICFDDFKIVRKGYVDNKFSDGIYLPNEEHVIVSLEEFDPYRGSLEFFIRPDWARSPLCNSCDDVREHTIVRIHGSGTDYSMSLFMVGEGLQYYVYDGDTHFILTDNSSTIIGQDATTHVALVWDFSGAGEKIMSILINNQLTTTLNLRDITTLPSFSEADLYMLYLGGWAWEGMVSPIISSADAVLENLKIYNYTIYDFSGSINSQGLHFPKRSSDLIEVSLDGSTFYSSEDRGAGLPINVGTKLPDESFDVYIRARDLEHVRPNEKNRTSYISISKIDVSS